MSSLRVGCCITAHGFGHGARTMAVMEALAGLVDLELTVVSQVPEWFLRNSYPGPLTLLPLATDVGLEQKGPLKQDIPATLKALAGFYPIGPRLARSLAGIFSGCRMVVCDIAPAGILAAREAGIPSVLLENFTWDWIYEGYLAAYPGLAPFIAYHRKINRLADFRVRTMPVCGEAEGDLLVPPVARAFREERGSVRHRLKIGDHQQMVLITMGGIGLDQLPVSRLLENRETVFVISGYTGKIADAPNLRFLATDTEVFHPDLVGASDAVIGKVGYSTVAEVYHGDVPFGYVCRRNFRESKPLASFVRSGMRGLEITPNSFRQGKWLDVLPKLFELPARRRLRENGAARCAEFLLSLAEKA